MQSPGGPSFALLLWEHASGLDQWWVSGPWTFSKESFLFEEQGPSLAKFLFVNGMGLFLRGSIILLSKKRPPKHKTMNECYCFPSYINISPNGKLVPMHKRDLELTLISALAITLTKPAFMGTLTKFTKSLVNIIRAMMCLIAYIKMNPLWSVWLHCGLYVCPSPAPRNSTELAYKSAEILLAKNTHLVHIISFCP